MKKLIVFVLVLSVVSTASAYTEFLPTATAPVIDGTVDAIWTTSGTDTVIDTLWREDSTKVPPYTIPTTSDAQVSWKGLWDSTNLYLLFEVTDDVLIDIENTAQVYNDDSIEFYLDPDNSDHPYGSYDTVNDGMYGINVHDGTVRKNAKTNWDNLANVVMAQADTTTGWTAELKIPWSNFGMTPNTWDLMGVTVWYNDDDMGELNARQHCGAWSDGDPTYLNKPYKDMESLPTVQLPEPITLILLGLGGLALRRRK